MRHFNRPLVLLVLFVLATYSCANLKNNASTETPDGHTAQNSLDWQGTYSGVLPCADCEGIETELKLNNDQTYSLTNKYLDGKNSSTDTLTGTFIWKGNNVELERKIKDIRPDVFKVEENQVKQLDLEGKEVTGELANAYILKKNGNSEVEDKKWKLVELNGKPVSGTADTHYIIFHSKEGRLEAKAGCNMMSYEYSIKNQLQVRFTPGITTLMACQETTEDKLKAVLDKADNISVGPDVLTLNKARMAPLARFELVK
ncbi:MAG TPA: copper resistance protein NlpE N-terminal domain-containing protein [Chitinophagales bacterium]|nr:copper resistance protein NlpE N-terminal domain-containing protein [Chitinophagales bacterium]HMU97517.1 copper resistance protein NlpE N-terminal domain-containing protein [Chitinophagales bacterium]HMV03721.1 copper resistance protein NlpE N-terminal domain-containing protein [Chitinophagales bacterium]HMY42252.1 copper resistance protein NlpE N-terminal domain-containing protein [Chitinophagales bacterium]HND45103.1 copper resistance protein NlpE N-terminal domain-containing protein [Chi